MIAKDGYATGRVTLVDDRNKDYPMVKVIVRESIAYAQAEKISAYGGPQITIYYINRDMPEYLQFDSADHGQIMMRAIYSSIFNEDGDVLWRAQTVEVEVPDRPNAWFKQTHWTRTPDAPGDRVAR
jgi:hypothetical protein